MDSKKMMRKKIYYIKYSKYKKFENPNISFIF